jgi:hypothetical protein
MQSSPFPCYLVPHRPKYPPQHLILEKRTTFTTIQNNRQDYSSVYLNLYTSGQQTGRQKILYRMIMSKYQSVNYRFKFRDAIMTRI